MAHETFRCEWVRCGKATCRSCPHGPYWYAYWREAGKVKKRYVGKGDPRVQAPAPEAEKAHPHDYIFFDSRATLTLAFEILGIPLTHDLEVVKRRYRELALIHHPDRGGDARTMSRINCAVAYIRRVLG